MDSWPDRLLDYLMPIHRRSLIFVRHEEWNVAGRHLHGYGEHSNSSQAAATIAELEVELEKRTAERDEALAADRQLRDGDDRSRRMQVQSPGAEYASPWFRIALQRCRRSIEKAGISL